MVGIGAFPVFMRTRRNIEPYSPLKPIKVGFIFFWPKSLSRAEDLAAVNHVTQTNKQTINHHSVEVRAETSCR